MVPNFLRSSRIAQSAVLCGRLDSDNVFQVNRFTTPKPQLQLLGYLLPSNIVIHLYDNPCSFAPHPWPNYACCPSKKMTQSPSPESIGGLYHEAAEHLRTYHGVTSITPVSLRRVVALLNLPMRRLVTQGLAPHWLPKDTQSPPLPQQQTETTMTLSAQYDNADLMSEHEYVSDNESEDGEDLDDEEVVEEVEDDRSAAAVATAAEDLPVGHDQQDESTTASETPDGGATQVQQTSLAPGAGNISREIAAAASNTTTTNRNNITETSPLHAALVAGGVTIHPYETDALIHALGVDPQRLVRLGLVNQEIVHAIPATATVRAKTRRSLGRPVGARKPKKVRVPVRVAGSKRRGPRGSTDGICAMGTSQSGELDEGAVVSWPQLVASATAVPQHLLAQSAGPATRGRGGTTCRRCMQVRACSRHGGHGHGPASRKQRSVE